MGRVAITGSSGLVGTGIVTYALKETKHDLVLVDTKPPPERVLSLLNEHKDRVQQLTLDLTIPENWEQVCKGADALIHLPALFPVHVGKYVAHNTSVALSWNALCAAVDANISRIVLMSSINAIGGLLNKECPKFKYFPLDEDHPSLAEDAYSVAKLILETQADTIARANPSSVYIASIRPHFVADSKPTLELEAETRKDMWAWTSSESLARACFLALEMKEKGLKPGHEPFFIVGPEHCCDGYESMDLAAKYYPDTEIRGGKLGPKQGFYSCEKAERLLGWKHEGGANPVGAW